MNEECLESRYEMRFPSLILELSLTRDNNSLQKDEEDEVSLATPHRNILLEVDAMLCMNERNFMQQPFNMLCHSCENILIMNEKIVHNDLSYEKILIKQN